MAASVLQLVTLALPASPPIDIGREEAQRRANEELAKGKYAGIPDWVSQLQEKANDFIRGLLEFLTGRGVSSEGANWGLLLVTVIVLALIAFVVWRVGLPRWQARKLAQTGEVGADQAVLPSTYRDLAEAAAAQGDYRTAIRERFRAIVRELEFRTIISPRPSRTAFEAAALASRELPRASEPMYLAAEVFSAVMYGGTPGSEQGWQQILTAEAAIHHVADQPREAVL